MRRYVIVAFALLVSYADLMAELHPVGCLPEDPTKIAWLHKARVIVGPTRSEVDLSPFMPPVGNQQTQGSCVAWAVGYYHKTYQEWFEHRWDVNDSTHRFSPAFIYNQINGGVDEGSRFSDALKMPV
ncbi:hypothetical protein CH333_05705 [candidate division WOR-3 bacterium JGI_Cruoil_03_44_89]|uniref:Peptidase C1A papain C-terminal domain-containing protein n=1 Tax=candidate division WOR-3 bacterium JGI_Cruoil_03_44_89 TaxID=1973748 RepID=A0A235BSH9_UNCW3|nr:MAG: hypothetical protein CH333_06590 [candidate division WOR-3 bacterium JGI_Cruoil_03_44_89]OYD15460.1 MAG: hypothetical protein CH333_05705 [candidate division WOR-3 bacterium JGI_Cruoil_03_44_89]